MHVGAAREQERVEAIEQLVGSRAQRRDDDGETTSALHRPRVGKPEAQLAAGGVALGKRQHLRGGAQLGGGDPDEGRHRSEATRGRGGARRCGSGSTGGPPRRLKCPTGGR
jgi:hypothetical protein